MTPLSCSQCGKPAAFSQCNLLSTVAISPRKQKCGIATLYCSACIQCVVELLKVSEHSSLQKLSQQLSEAYTALVTLCEPDSHNKTGAPVLSRRIEAVARCRLCLIACNSSTPYARCRVCP